MIGSIGFTVVDVVVAESEIDAGAGVAAVEMIGTVIDSVDAPAGNVTDSLKGVKNGLAAIVGSLLVESTDALKSTVTGSSRAAAVYPPVAGTFAGACSCARDSVTVNELSSWFTDSLDGVMSRNRSVEDTELALRSARLSSNST